MDSVKFKESCGLTGFFILIKGVIAYFINLYGERPLWLLVYGVGTLGGNFYTGLDAGGI